MATPKLQARGVRLEYYQPRTGARLLALDQVDLTVDEGEFVSVVGPSGCGKTTFLNIVDGLLKATAGHISLNGTVIDKPDVNRAMVFQDPSLLPWRTVLKNVIYGLECQGRADAEREGQARRLIKLVGLAGFEQHYPHELSGGMQQRVNLARALAVDPEILLTDEPFAALDAQTREFMQVELLRIWSETRKTVLFVTHQINEAVFLSDRVIVFTARPGRVKESVPIDLPRPRTLQLKRDRVFLDLEDRIWGLIEDEVRRTMAADQVAHP